MKSEVVPVHRTRGKEGDVFMGKMKRRNHWPPGVSVAGQSGAGELTKEERKTHQTT